MFVPHGSLEVFEPVVHFKASVLKVILKAILPNSTYLVVVFLSNPLVSMDILFCLHVVLLACFVNPVTLKLII